MSQKWVIKFKEKNRRRVRSGAGEKSKEKKGGKTKKNSMRGGIVVAEVEEKSNRKVERGPRTRADKSNKRVKI